MFAEEQEVKSFSDALAGAALRFHKPGQCINMLYT